VNAWGVIAVASMYMNGISAETMNAKRRIRAGSFFWRLLSIWDRVLRRSCSLHHFIREPSDERNRETYLLRRQ